MTLSYTTHELQKFTLDRVKDIADRNGVDPKAVRDRRRKQDWIEAIEFVKVEAFCKTEWETEQAAEVSPAFVESLAEVSDLAPVDEATETEQGLLATLNLLADAEQAAILENRQEDARKFSDAYEETLAEYEAVIGKSIESLARESMAICEQGEAVRVTWQGEAIGTVSVDYGATERVFTILDLFTTNPVIKVITTNGTVIDSRWQTTRNNRYIKAVQEAIPARLAKLVDEICEHSMSRHRQHITPPDYIYAGGDGEGERRGGNGNGDDRGRLNGTVSASDWPYDIDLF